MSESAANPWKRLRLCARLLTFTSIASMVVFLLSLAGSLVVFSPFNSLVIALSGGGLTISGNTSDTGGTAAQSVSGPIQVHLLDTAHRFTALNFSTVWHDVGFRQINIPIYIIFAAFMVLAVLADRSANAAAKRAGLCHHCGYPRGSNAPARCPECGHTAKL